MQKKIIAVVGPTASGKTGLAIEIAKRTNGEIVSCDSMQIYKGISIASAAPTAEEKAQVTHHLIEFLEPEESFSVAEYVSLAKSAVDDIISRGKTPILCGGTGLYFTSFIDNISFDDQPGKTEIRDELKRELAVTSPEHMHQKLRELDPGAAEKLSVSDSRRVIRALELFMLTGLTFEERAKLSKSNPSPYDPIIIGLDFKDRSILYDRIERRVDMMLDLGVVQESKNRFEISGGSAQAIGHKEFFAYFRCECELQDAVDTLKISTRHYAKRQLTWFRRDDRINWIYLDEVSNPIDAAMNIINEN